MALDIPDKELIIAIKKGDKEAYSKLYLAYCTKLCKYIYSLSPNYKQAEDIVQDTLLDIWTRRDELNIKTSLNNYLYRSVHNKFINLYRKDMRRQSFLDGLYLDGLYTEAIVELDSLEQDNKEVRLSALQKIIDKLPQKRKEIFILSKLNNYKYREIAEMRNISERTVETQIRIAMMTVREEMMRLRVAGIIPVLLPGFSLLFLFFS